VDWRNFISHIYNLAVIRPQNEEYKQLQNMAKGLLGGMTDYSHQSFDDIIKDLESEKNNTIAFIKIIEENIAKANENNYWNDNVPFDFKSMIAYSLKHYGTSVTELNEIGEEIQYEVQEHHCKRLQRISEVAREINVEIGQVWHQRYDRKEYGKDDFRFVENVYENTRDIAVNLLDISNIASRLNDFIGKKKVTMEKKNSFGSLSNATFGNNATIIVGDNNQLKISNVTKGNFEDLRNLFSKNNITDEDLNELKNILEQEQPNTEKEIFGKETNGWISRMVNKCLDGSWSIGIGAAGKLLADGIKSYYGWHV